MWVCTQWLPFLYPVVTDFDPEFSSVRYRSTLPELPWLFHAARTQEKGVIGIGIVSESSVSGTAVPVRVPELASFPFLLSACPACAYQPALAFSDGIGIIAISRILLRRIDIIVFYISHPPIPYPI